MMKKMKMLLAALLCVGMLLPACGLAAPGDAVLARQDYESEDGFQDYIQFVFARGDELVLLGGNAVYTWQVGQADLTAYAWPQEDMTGGEEEIDPETGESIYRSKNTLAAFSDGEGIYLVIGESTYSMYSEFEGAYLYEVTLADGKAEIVPVEDGEIDWEELLQYYEEDTYANMLENVVYCDGVLYGVAYGSSDMEAYAIPLDGGYSEVIEDIVAPRTIAPYKDGKVMFMLYDYNTPESVRFVAWNPEEEEIEELCSIAIEMYAYPSGVTYSEETDRVYYVHGGSVMALDLETGESEPVNDIPSGNGGNSAAMLPGGYYVFAGYDATVVRNIDPSQKAAYRLAVSNGSYAEPINAAYYDFTNVRGDVSVAVSTEYMSSASLVEAMMNQSADFDIYVVGAYEEAFDSLYSRGYMAEITGSEKIDTFFDEMYPQLAERFSYEGVPVALPLSCYGNAFGVSTSALEKAGLTMDDIPTNWLELLDQLDDLNARLEGTGVSLFYNWYTQKDIKASLFTNIFENYVDYMNYTDPTMGYNTEILLSVLNKLEEIDFAALGFMESDEDDMEAVAYSASSDEALFETFAGCTIGEFYSDYMPVLLSLTPDIEPVMSLNITTAFINPYSENKELAVAYLEAALDNLPRAAYASLCDIEIEPVRSSYYEEAVQNNEETLESLQKALAEADEEDKQMIEEAIAENERWAEQIEKNYWEISPAAIEWYRSHDDAMIPEKFNILYSEDNYSEISPYILQYYEGEIGPAEMLAAMDKKLQMMILEGN